MRTFLVPVAGLAALSLLACGEPAPSKEAAPRPPACSVSDKGNGVVFFSCRDPEATGFCNDSFGYRFPDDLSSYLSAHPDRTVASITPMTCDGFTDKFIVVTRSR